MGLSRDGVRFLLYAKRLGVDFSRTATLGRQDLEVRRGALARELADFGHRLGKEDMRRAFVRGVVVGVQLARAQPAEKLVRIRAMNPRYFRSDTMITPWPVGR